MADILEWVKNPEGGSDFELQRNRTPDEIDSGQKIEDIQPQPEEETKDLHPRCQKKKLTKSRLVHSIDSALNPSNYDEMSHLNKHGHIGRKFKKVT